MSEHDKDASTTRRHFFQATGLAACGVATGGAALLSADFLVPRVLFEPATRFTLGPPATVDVGEVVTNEEFRAYVVRRPDGFRALSAVCTHLGCITRYQAGEGIITCPCHGSRFDLDGEVIAGPAPRHLEWLEMRLSTAGEIEVDTASKVPSGTVFRL